MTHLLNTLPNFLIYFVSSLVFLAVAVRVYIWITPYDELAEIRQGNTAAAISLVGTILGLVIPIASIIMNSYSILEVLAWSGVSFAVQITLYFILDIWFTKVRNAIIVDKCNSHAILMAGLAITMGILQAA